jgi:hypothetical protein
MFDLFKSLIPARNHGALADAERAYLAAAVSRYDLERRERDVERGLFRQPHPYL